MNLNALAGNASKKLNLTNQQQDIVDSTEKTILVNAVAGSGKTATLMEMAKQYDKGIYLAFNKAIVKDVIDKLPMGWQCNTFNSFGLKLIRQHWPKSKVNFRKYYDYGSGAPVMLVSNHMSLSGNISDTSWKDTCQRFKIAKMYIPEAKSILAQGKLDTSVISGDDMLQYPIDNGWKSDPYDIVLVDECQDLNPQQIDFLSCIPTKKIVFVGDANQAIYGFRGSDPFALEKIKDTYFPEEYQLSESFRCPVELLQAVKRIVPQIVSKKTGGKIYTQRSNDVDYAEECFIISRINSHLIILANQFIREKKHFSIGSKFIKQLKNNLNPMLRGASNITEVRRRIQTKYDADYEAASDNKWNKASIENKYDSLLTIMDYCNSLSEIKEFIEDLNMHKDGSSTRKLMTIHASKGLETEHVYFLKSDMCEYFKDRALAYWEKQQEDNLYYVACTRALQTLTFVD